MHYFCDTFYTRVRCIRNFFLFPYAQLFFIRFKANLSKYGSCSLHIRMWRNIRKHHLLASFAPYSLQNILKQIRKQIFDLMLKIHVAANICFRANICLRLSHTGEYLLPNICLEANICKTLSKFHIQANIRLQIVTYCTSKYSLAIFAYQQVFAIYCFKLFRSVFHESWTSINIRFFLKIFAEKGIFASVLFSSHLKSADLLRCETN
jgi:hypothetical protein